MSRERRGIPYTGIMSRITPAAVVVLLASVPASAYAQRVAFERRMPAREAVTLDARTIRGRIEITAGQPGEVVINGAATVRVGWDVPRDAEALAHAVAANPPITQDARGIHLAPPDSANARRAVTVSYQVQVPPGTRVVAASESGAIAIRGAGPTVTVRTQSGAIDLEAIRGDATVTSGSGDVTIENVEGPLAVTTKSSAVTARELGGSAHVRTESGAVELGMAGDGDVDVQTGSSAITIGSARHGITATSRSGRVSLAGIPGAAWTADTGSAAIDIAVPGDAAFTLDAVTRSGSIVVDAVNVQGTQDKRAVQGRVGAGGPLVQLRTRSGSIAIRTAP